MIEQIQKITVQMGKFVLNIMDALTINVKNVKI